MERVRIVKDDKRTKRKVFFAVLNPEGFNHVERPVDGGGFGVDLLNIGRHERGGDAVDRELDLASAGKQFRSFLASDRGERGLGIDAWDDRDRLKGNAGGLKIAQPSE